MDNLSPNVFVIALICLIGVPFQGRVNAQPSLTLWTTSFANKGQCRGYSKAISPQVINKVIQGYKWPNTIGGGGEFIDQNTKHLNMSVSGPTNDKSLLSRLLGAARSDALTKLDFESPGGGSPAFVSAIVVKSVAYSVSYLRTRSAITPTEVEEIDKWIQKLMKNSRAGTPSMDHKAANAVAQIMWGAATNDGRLFKKGQSQLDWILRKLKRSAYFSDDIRNNNEVMHHVIHGSHVLWVNGINVFDKNYGKRTLHDATAYHANQVRQNGANPIKTSGDPSDLARSIMRAQGWGTHLAWIPIYLSLFRSSGASQEVKALDQALRTSDRKPYYGRQIGIHSGCLYGARS